MNRRFSVVWVWLCFLWLHGENAAVLADGGHEYLWLFLSHKKDADGQLLMWRNLGMSHSRSEQDLSVNADYIEHLHQLGVDVRTRSRWLNAVSVRVAPEMRSLLEELSFVRAVERVRRFRRPKTEPAALPLPAARPAVQGGYGPSFEQMAQVGVISLHQRGFTGEGVRIAVIDNGFHYVEHKAFQQKLNVVAERDFVNGDGVVSDEDDQPVTGDETRSAQNLHGAQVLSVLAAYDPDRFIGVAPDAEYILAKTEDNATELPVEEDRWIAGLEWADSLGADVVNSSLGYNIWDVGDSYEYADLDGETALTTRAAALAVQRGLVVVVAAGNEGRGLWHYITAPADAEGVIAVGSVDVPVGSERLPRIAASSSRGPTADGRIKPDVVAPGEGVVVADLRGGDYMRSSGTSFAAPLVSGICALLLQAHPEWDAAQVLEALRSTALDLGEAGPDTIYGWGQVDALAASGLPLAVPDGSMALAPFPNPAHGKTVFFPLEVERREEVELSVFDLAGNLVFQRSWDLLAGAYIQSSNAPRWDAGDDIANGLYFYRMRSLSIDRSGTIALVRP